MTSHDTVMLLRLYALIVVPSHYPTECGRLSSYPNVDDAFDHW
jgi:hypothetical protein